MTTQLAPFIQAVPFVGVDAEGRAVRAHPSLLKWMSQQLEPRTGGITAPTNIDLQEQVTITDAEVVAINSEIDDIHSALDAVPPSVPVNFPDADEAVGVADLRARVAVLEQLVAQLREGPTP